MQDPNIKNMAEQIAQDPAFAQMSAALQASMANGGNAPAQAAGQPPIDPEQYAQAMTSVLSNPGFMEMAEKLGQQIMTVRPKFGCCDGSDSYGSWKGSFLLTCIQSLLPCLGDC